MSKKSKVLHLLGKAVRIISAVDGFRRAEMAHRKEATDHPEGTFTEEQLEALEAEPNLIVQAIDAQETGASTPEENTGEPDDPIAKLLKGNVGDVVARLAEVSDESIRAQALKAELAKDKKARPGVLKALGVEQK